MSTTRTDAFIAFNDAHSLALRIWHWTTFAVITTSIVLVLMGTFMFKTRDNVGMVQEQLEHKGATVTKDQARSVAHEYSDKIWMTHKFVGYGLCFLLLSRILLEAAQPGEEKYRAKLKRALMFQSADAKHYRLVKQGYLLFYFLFFVMAATGLVLAFEDVAFLDPIHEPMGKLHEFTQYGIYAFILIHLTGVVRAEIGSHDGVVSAMFHGKKRKG